MNLSSCPKRGSDASVQDGDAPLHRACGGVGRESPFAIRTLLAHQAINVNIRDNLGRTHLHWASMTAVDEPAHTVGVDLLLAHAGIDVNAADQVRTQIWTNSWTILEIQSRLQSCGWNSAMPYSQMLSSISTGYEKPSTHSQGGASGRRKRWTHWSAHRSSSKLLPPVPLWCSTKATGRRNCPQSNRSVISNHIRWKSKRKRLCA